MNIATWNVNSLHVRLPQVLAWLEQNPDVGVLALQETKTTDDKFPTQAFTEAGYRVEIFGQKTYNGVALISRPTLPPAQAVVRNIPGFDDEMAGGGGVFSKWARTWQRQIRLQNAMAKCFTRLDQTRVEPSSHADADGRLQHHRR
jgi:exonuclease III